MSLYSTSSIGGSGWELLSSVDYSSLLPESETVEEPVGDPVPDPEPIPPDALVVSTSEELMSALANAAGGDTIYLAAGEYGEVDLSGLNFDSQVTIRSAEPLQASFSKITIHESSYLSLDGVTVEYIRAADEPEWTRAIDIEYADHITITNSEIHGSDDSNYANDSYLITIGNSTAIGVSGSSLHDGYRAIIVSESSDITLEQNDVFDMRSDGFNFAAVTDVTISGNTFSNFYPLADDHPDGIQFWTTDTPYDSSNVVIRDNTFLQGEGLGYQAIFIENKIDGRGFDNFEITGNIVYNSYFNGITVYNGSNILIANNTLIPFPGSELDPTIRLVDSVANVTVENNISSGYSGLEEDGGIVTSTNNLFLQDSDPTGWNYVGTLFADGLAGAIATRDSFLLLPGASPDGVDFSTIGGSSYNPTPESLTAIIDADNHRGEASSMMVEVDASLSTTTTGTLPEDAEILWDFGDGTVASGVTGEHLYATPGVYQISLTITSSEGTATATRMVEVVSPLSISVDDFQDVSGFEQVGSISDAEGALGFNGSGFVNLGRSTDYFGMNELYVSLDIRGDGVNTGPERIVWNNYRYGIEIKNSDLVFHLTTEEGGVSFVASGVNVDDGNWHNIALSYDSATGIAVGYVDGVEVTRLEGVQGRIEGPEFWDLTLGGTPWGDYFTGEIDNFEIWTSATGEEGVPLTSVTETATQSSTLVSTQTVQSEDTETSLLSDKEEAEPVPIAMEEPIEDSQTTVSLLTPKTETSGDTVTVSETGIVEAVVEQETPEEASITTSDGVNYDVVYEGINTLDDIASNEEPEPVVYDRHYLKELWNSLKASYEGQDAKIALETQLQQEAEADWDFSGFTFHGIHF